MIVAEFTAFCTCEILGSTTTYFTTAVGSVHEASSVHLSAPKPETNLQEFEMHVLKQHFLPSGSAPSE